MEQEILLTQINVFPLKSARKTELQSAKLDRFGVCGDRRWMVVDQAGSFITGRKYPRLTLIGVTSLDGGILLQADEHEDLMVYMPSKDASSSVVNVWDDNVDGQDAGNEAAAWLTEVLGIPCCLTYMADDTNRQVDMNYASEGVVTSFADGFPLLLIGEASLTDLNQRLSDPVSMDRFRPNLVVSTDEPFIEDRWKRIRIGGIELSLVKPCGRCIMVTVDPDSGATGKEPLKTLAKYRRQGNEVMFGQNLIHHAEGEIYVGDKVEVLEWN